MISIPSFSSGTPFEFFGDLFSTTSEATSKLTSSTTMNKINEGINRRKKLELYVMNTYTNLKEDSAKGQGEYLEAFYDLSNYKGHFSKAEIYNVFQTNFEALFKNKEYSPEFFTIFDMKVNGIQNKL